MAGLVYPRKKSKLIFGTRAKKKDKKPKVILGMARGNEYRHQRWKLYGNARKAARGLGKKNPNW